MSRRPGYETNSWVSYDQENRRETMTMRTGGGIGRPRGAGHAAGRGEYDEATQRMHADWQAEYTRLKTRLDELTAP